MSWTPASRALIGYRSCSRLDSSVLIISNNNEHVIKILTPGLRLVETTESKLS